MQLNVHEQFLPKNALSGRARDLSCICFEKRGGIQFQRTEIDGYGKWLVCEFPTFCTFLWQMV